MLDQSLAFLDLETTGATATHDRITEIGVVEVERGRFVEQWSTLVNPEMRIPPMIETLTGITNDMVAEAPTFAEIGKDLLQRLKGKLLVAHNARFDYGFLKNEFSRIGHRYTAKVLCTVKLSRRLFPEHRRHNLDSLIERHGLTCTSRHRALGDAQVLWQFVQKLYRELDPARIHEAVEALLKSASLPASLPAEMLEDLPEGPGVYVFYGENDAPLYVGKSVNLRSRVMSHFTGDHRVNKDMRISQQIIRVDWTETTGELGALIKEAKLIKELVPIHNRQLRRNTDLCSFHFDPAEDDQPQLVRACEIDFTRTGNLYGLFRSKRDALNMLRSLANDHRLCHRVLGLEDGRKTGPCFAHQIKKCKGACVGKESLKTHAMRLMAALDALRVKSWPFRGRIGIRETEPWSDKAEVHVLDRWCYLGTLRSEWELFDSAALGSDPVFDLDTYKILTRYFERNLAKIEVIDLSGTGNKTAA